MKAFADFRHHVLALASYNLLSVDAELDDCDDEDGADDEPSLGSGNAPCGNGTSYFFDSARDGSLDCEGDEHDGREPEDHEPSLGSTRATINQERWASGYSGGSRAGDDAAV